MLEHYLEGTWEETRRCMVAAYNRGIDDAVGAVKLEKASNYGKYAEDPNPKFKPVEIDVIDHTFYGHGDCGYEAVRVSKDSILKLKI